MPFITDAPLHARCIAPYNTALVGGMFPMEMEDEEEQDQEQEEEEKEPVSGPYPDNSHMEGQLHEEKDRNTENCGSSLAQDPPSSSPQVRRVLINGLTCEELLHSIRFESDREGSPGYYGPAEYQRDEEFRRLREEEERAQEALMKKMKQGSQETRKRKVSEASSEI
ncbi:hypothetical protein BGZ92_000621, partial [Podila epicladia]